MTGVRWARESPPPSAGGGAIAVFHLRGDIDGAFRRLGMKEVAVGRAVVRDFGGVDAGVAARPARDHLLLMPHAGRAADRGIVGWLMGRGIREGRGAPALERYPEAGSRLEAEMLAALAGTESVLAADLLLDQPRRWRAWAAARGLGEFDPVGAGASELAALDPGVGARSAVLNRLLRPPMVVSVGAPNIGKSSLLNALAGRAAALVADEEGTTRDHVGVSLNLGGLVACYVDAPGVDAGAADPALREAQEIARRVAAVADVVLLCCDASARAPEFAGAGAVVRVGLRRDLGAPLGAVDVETSVRQPTTLEALVRVVREALAPAEVLQDGGPWVYWGECGEG